MADSKTSQQSQSVQSALQKFLFSEKFSDLTITIGRPPNQQSFPAHRCVLATGSAKLEQLVKDKAILTLDDDDPLVWKLFLSFLYTGSIAHVPSPQLLPLAILAKKYDVERLDESFIPTLETATPAELLSMASWWSTAPDLLIGPLHIATLRAFSRALTIEGMTSPIATLPRTALRALLSLDGVATNEYTILQRLMDWGNASIRDAKAAARQRKLATAERIVEPTDDDNKEIPSLKEVLGDLVHLIRFPIMTDPQRAVGLRNGLITQEEADICREVFVQTMERRQPVPSDYKLPYNPNPRCFDKAYSVKLVGRGIAIFHHPVRLVAMHRGLAFSMVYMDTVLEKGVHHWMFTTEAARNVWGVQIGVSSRSDFTSLSSDSSRGLLQDEKEMWAIELGAAEAGLLNVPRVHTGLVLTTDDIITATYDQTKRTFEVALRGRCVQRLTDVGQSNMRLVVGIRDALTLQLFHYIHTPPAAKA